MAAIELASNLSGAAALARNYLVDYSAALPAARKARLDAVRDRASPVDLVVGAMEGLYAMLEEEDDPAAIPAIDDARTAMANAANQCALAGFHGKTDRGAAILAVARYDNGETATAPERPAVEPGWSDEPEPA